MEILEYKILQEIRANLNIKYTTEDAITHLKNVEQLMNVTKKVS
jgi:hypothetical protein